MTSRNRNNRNALKPILGNSFLKQHKKIAFSEAIGSYAVIGIYFGAFWCGPCLNFTPTLRDVYKKWKSQSRNIEILFISDDKSGTEFEKYYYHSGFQGDWIAIPFANESKRKELSSNYEVNGIPKLIFVDNKGRVVENEGRKLIGEQGVDAIKILINRVPELAEKRFTGVAHSLLGSSTSSNTNRNTNGGNVSNRSTSMNRGKSPQAMAALNRMKNLGLKDTTVIANKSSSETEEKTDDRNVSRMSRLAIYEQNNISNDSGQQKEKNGSDQQRNGNMELGSGQQRSMNLGSGQQRKMELGSGQQRNANLGSGQQKNVNLGSGQQRNANLGSGQQRKMELGSGQKRNVNLGSGQQRNVSLGSGQKRNANLGSGQQRNVSLGSGQKRNVNLGSGQKRNASLGSGQRSKSPSALAAMKRMQNLGLISGGSGGNTMVSKENGNQNIQNTNVLQSKELIADLNAETVKVCIILIGGKRITLDVNLSHSVRDIYAHVKHVSGHQSGFKLLAGYPLKHMSDMNQAVFDANLKGARITQKAF